MGKLSSDVPLEPRDILKASRSDDDGSSSKRGKGGRVSAIERKSACQ